MSSYKNQKIYNFLLKKKSYVDVKKYIITKDDNGQNYALFQMVNNYHDVLKRIVLVVKQFDLNKKLINEMEIPYENLSVKPHCKFVPYFKLMIDQNTDKIEATIKEANFVEHNLINGKMNRIKKEKKEEDTKKKEGLVQRVNVLKTEAPKKLFMVMSGIVLLTMAIFILFFSFTNRTLVDQSSDLAIDNKNGYIVNYYGTAENIIIPESVCGVTVKGIGEEAFKGAVAKVVTINAKSVTISKKAFYGCSNLIYVLANEINGIGESAFENCGMLESFSASANSIIIKGVIGKAAFRNCKSLKSFKSDYIESVNSNSFYDCTSLETLYLPNAIFYPNVFYNCIGLKELTFNDVSNNRSTTLSSIFSNQTNYKNTIINCKMNKVYDDFIGEFVAKKYNFINPSVEFSREALADLKSRAVEQNQHIIANGYEKVFDMIISIDAPQDGVLSIVDSDVKGILMSAVQSIGSSVQSMNLQCSCLVNSAFMDCFPKLTTLTLGSNVSIEEKTFSLYYLKSIELPIQGASFKSLFKVIPNNLSVRLVYSTGENGRIVPEEYFNNCEGITNIAISSNITTISKNAITKCGNLKSLVISPSVTKMDLPIVGENCLALADITLPFIGSSASVPIPYDQLNLSYNFTKKISIVATSPVKLAEGCFEKCMMLKAINLNSGITNDSNNCFRGIKSLDSLYIANNFGESLISLFNYPVTIKNLCIKNFSNSKEGYFSTVIISNLFIESSNLNSSVFNASDQISVINIASSIYGNNYEATLDSISKLNSINYQKAISSYEHKKNVTYGFDYYSAYSAVFN